MTIRDSEGCVFTLVIDTFPLSANRPKGPFGGLCDIRSVQHPCGAQ